MPIDPDFKTKRKIVDKQGNVDVWGPIDPPKQLGIRGTKVAVDWDVCNGDGVCIDICPVTVFELVNTLGHPASDKKSNPTREEDCIQCLACETQCPTQAIKVDLE